MKEFCQIAMVNWWLFEAPMIIEVKGHVLLTGANASGKSSILDAAQTTILGGDQRKLRFNQRADDKSKRDLKSYCLGVATGKPQEGSVGSGLEPRTSALTHLALTWRDEDGSYINAGVLLTVRASDSRVEPELQYILIGPKLTAEDFVSTDSALDKAGMRASLEALAARARREKPQWQPSLTFCRNTSDYQERLAAALSGAGGQISAERLMRAFVGCLQFRPDNNIDSFVRSQVLPERRMNLDDMRRAILDYRTIKEKIQQTIVRLASLKEIGKLFADAANKASTADQFRWVAAEANCLAYLDALAELDDRLDKVNERVSKAGVVLQKSEDVLEQLKSRRQQLEVTRAGEEPEKQALVFEAQLKAVEAEESAANRTIDRAVEVWTKTKNHLTTTPNAPSDLVNAVTRLTGHARQFDDGGLPTDQELNAAVRTTLDCATQWSRGLSTEIAKQSRLQDEAERRVLELSQSIETLQGGRVDLPDHTKCLIAALRQRNIEAYPACSMIELVDEEWRDAIESVLGMKKFALIIDPNDLEEANRIYRVGRKIQGFQGARIFATHRTEEYLARSPVLNTVAAKLRSENRHAQAWIRRSLGGIAMADSASEVKKQLKTPSLTIEGRHYDGTYVNYLRTVPPAIGRDAANLRLPKLREEVDLATRASRRALDARVQLDLTYKFLNDTVPLIRDRADVGPAMRDSIAKRNQAAALRKTIDATITPEMRQLKRDIEALGSQVNDAGTLVLTRRNESAAAVEEQRKAQTARDQAAAACDEKQRQRAMAEAVPGLDRAGATLLLQKLQEKHASEELPGFSKDFSINATVSMAATKRAKSSDDDAANARTKASNMLGEHRVTYKVEGLSAESTVLQMETWVTAEINRVEESELHTYEARAIQAEKSVSSTIRGDFSGHLIQARKEMWNIINERNALLAAREFSGGNRYEFKPKVREEFKAILDWLDEIQNQDQQTKDDTDRRKELFSEAKFKEAQEKVMAVLNVSGEIPADKLSITDYRSYYTFDMLVHKAGGGAYSVQQMLGHGSGGERYTPLYMAVGSAICGAYRITTAPNGEHVAGATLALFDEVFNNLDVDNIDSCMRVLQSFGLQLIIACPDEKEPTLRGYADTNIEMIKDGGTVIVNVSTLKQAGKDLYRQGFPLELKSPAPKPTEARAG